MCPETDGGEEYPPAGWPNRSSPCWKRSSAHLSMTDIKRAYAPRWWRVALVAKDPVQAGKHAGRDFEGLIRPELS